MNSTKEILITGIGVVSPIGIGLDAFWDGLINGRSGIRIRPDFADTPWPLKMGGTIVDFEGKKYVKPRKALKVMCLPIQWGFSAAMMAMENAGLEIGQVDPDRVATVFGSEPFYAAPSEISEVFRKCTEEGIYDNEKWGEFFMREIQPLWMLKYLPNMVASHISIGLDSRGPSNSICQGEVSSLLSVIEGATLIQRGIADVVMVGGTGEQTAITGLLYHGRDHLSPNIENPEQACRPFEANRDGQVVGDGAAAIVLESAEHARQRNANVYGSLMGWQRTYCPHDQDLSDAIGTNLLEALENASLTASDMNFYNSTGVAGKAEDVLEATAIARLFGPIPTMASKANFGNLGPAAGAMELAAGLLAMKNQQLPPAINYETPDPACPVTMNAEINAERPMHFAKTSFSKTDKSVR